MAVEKLYESENYIIVNKPYDMYINSDDEDEKNTVTHHIAKHDSHLSTSSQPLHFVQRLDYATSGVLCIAKNKSAAARAGKLFEGRLTKKYYLAVVRGHVGFELGDITYPVGVDPLTQQSSHRMLAVFNKSDNTCEQSREAHTRLLVLESGYCGSDPVTVVLLKPVTGRRHQLRVHCKAIGHTILGDYTYSDKKDSAPHRMFLHAIRLVLPLHSEPLDIQTSEPFFIDKRFQSQWKSVDIFNKYRTKEAFRVACDVIDRPYVIGVKYQSYSAND
ncbi:RNA pseudouridylate synthase domain-containing protein 1-like [Plodia interpunctella]|uniref:RNA pseudouridylate synthase domain-containing protein 1-like n=1 Tax=Plodia interpunctella TaxID=58824 RepID=UPI0023680179|nr:RNA pseudouridylate synthase domain-containing protein 1-like [Plodia interpunctella]